MHSFFPYSNSKESELQKANCNKIDYQFTIFSTRLVSHFFFFFSSPCDFIFKVPSNLVLALWLSIQALADFTLSSAALSAADAAA